MSGIEAVMTSVVAGVASNIAYDLIKAGTSYLGRRMLDASALTALEGVWRRALEKALSDVCTDLSKDEIDLVEWILTTFVRDPAVAEALMGPALDGKPIDIDGLATRFDAMGFDRETFPLDFGQAMDALGQALERELSLEASKTESPLFNRVVLAYLNQVRSAIHPIEQIPLQAPTGQGRIEAAAQLETRFALITAQHTNQDRVSMTLLGSLDRPEVDKVLRAIEECSTAFLIGEGGSGKSGILGRVALKLQSQGRPVLFISADSYPRNSTNMQSLDALLQLGMPISDALRLLAGRGQLPVLVCDQLDDVAGTDLSRLLCTFLANISAALPGMGVVAASRAFEAKHSQELRDLPFRRIESHRLDAETAGMCLRKLGLAEPGSELIEIARNLLALSIIAELAQTGVAVSRITGQTELWQRYRQSIEEREGAEALATLVHLARNAGVQGMREFALPIAPDASMQRLISRAVLVRSRGDRYRFRHQEIQDYLYAWDAALRRTVMAREVLAEVPAEMAKGILKWMQLLYHLELPEQEAPFVASLLDSGPEVDFYTRVTALDLAKQQSDPSPMLGCVLGPFLERPPYARYFFRDLSDPAWLSLLGSSRLFSKPPAPVEAGTGLYQLPVWEAGEYLLRVSATQPGHVVAVVDRLQSDNARAHHTLLEAALRMPVEWAAKMVPVVLRGLDASFGPIDPSLYGKLMTKLANGDQWDQALELLAGITKPVVPAAPKLSQEVAKAWRQQDVRCRIDNYWLQQIMATSVLSLAEKQPDIVSRLLARQLANALQMEWETDTGQGDPSRYASWADMWDEEPESRASEEYKTSALHAIAGIGIHYGSNPAMRPVVSEYLKHPFIVFRRLGIRIVTAHLGVYLDLVEEILGKLDILADDAVWPEIHELLETGFALLPHALSTGLVGWITAGPPQGLIERQRRWYQKSEDQDPPVKHMEAWADRWVLERLSPLRGHDLPAQARSQLDRLTALYGNPPPPHRGGVVTSFVGPVSPRSKDELNAMTPMEVVDYLRTYVPQPTEACCEPSREGLARVLQEAVNERPEQYVQVARQFAGGSIRPIYAAHLFRGLEKAWESGKDFDWVPVLALMGTLVRGEVAAPESRDEEDRDEWNWVVVNHYMASLIEEGVRRDQHAMPDDQMVEARDILLWLASQPDPDLDVTSESTFDPATRAINSGRGRAVQALIMYALRRARSLEANTSTALGEPSPMRLEVEVKQTLTERLDRSKETSEAVHSLFGKFLPQLRYLDREWLGDHLKEILPPEVKHEAYWQAAWSSYVAFNSVYQDLYPLLRQHYRRAVESLAGRGDLKASLESVADRLAGHVLAAYWGGLETLDEDSILALLYRFAPAGVRSNAAHTIHGWLVESDEEAKRKVWPRLQPLWAARLAAADAATDPAEFRPEVAACLWWLAETPVDLDDLHDLIERSLPHSEEGRSGDMLLEYLHKQAVLYPELAVHLLLQMMVVGPKPYRYKQDEVSDILTRAMTSGKSDARADADKVINLFGERGEYVYRGLLDL